MLVSIVLLEEITFVCIGRISNARIKCMWSITVLYKNQRAMVNVTQRSYREGSIESLSDFKYFDENIVYDVMIATLTNFNSLTPELIVIYKGIWWQARKKGWIQFLKDLVRKILSQNDALRSIKSRFFDAPKMYPFNALKMRRIYLNKRKQSTRDILVNMKSYFRCYH